MKAILTLALFYISTNSLASIDQAPPSFKYKDSRAVYVDFTAADYQLSFDVASQTVKVESTIRFTQAQAGRPIFDLNASIQGAELDGTAAPLSTINDPDMMSAFLVVNRVLDPGEHVLKVKSSFTTNVVFSAEGVAAGLWMSDLNDRRYLEQYLPANLEFDQYPMHLTVTVTGAEGKPHLLKANGKVTELAENSFDVVLPEFYTGSSVYLHLFPAKNSFATAQFYYSSIDGRQIPVDIYTIYNATEFADATRTILAELEADYGPFPHDQLIIYGNAPSGGMEHSGATITSLSALGHELFHSYHARGLMPANGNAGWMDEAIARWRDNKYPLLEVLPYESNRLAGHSRYLRMTNRMAYTEGSQFLSWIAFRMNAQGLSFKSFLREYFEKFKYTTVTTELFQQEMSVAARMDLTPEFDQYIYGRTHNKRRFSALRIEEDPHHPIYTTEELLEMTWPTQK